MEHVDINPVEVKIKNRIKNNKNVIIVINGATGSGKTYSAIELARKVSLLFETNFNIDDNMAFEFVELLKKTQLPQNQKPGTPFVFEEVGAAGGGASSREWQSKANKFFFSFLQTTRHRNQILILTCPHFSFLEAGARKLVHLQMDMAGINFGAKKAKVKVYEIQVNSRTGKSYFKYIRFQYKKRKYKFSILELDCPPDDMVEAYEKEKTKFTDRLNKSIIADGDGKSTTKKKYGKTNANRFKEVDVLPISQREKALLCGISLSSWKTLKIEVENSQNNSVKEQKLPIL